MSTDTITAPKGATAITAKGSWDLAFAAWQAAKATYDEVAALYDADCQAAEVEGRQPNAELGERVDALANPECDTRLALMQTPAPDFAAVLFKIKTLWARDDAPENDDYTDAWHRRYPDAVIADMIRLQADVKRIDDADLEMALCDLEVARTFKDAADNFLEEVQKWLRPEGFAPNRPLLAEMHKAETLLNEAVCRIEKAEKRIAQAIKEGC